MERHSGDCFISQANETVELAMYARQQNRHWVNVYFLSGLAVEHALWGVRCRSTRLTEADYEVVPGHNLNKLLIHSGAVDEFRIQMRKTRGLRTNWMVVKDWDSNRRYRRVSQSDAKEIHQAGSRPSRWCNFPDGLRA